jgi:hypothetical protein
MKIHIIRRKAIILVLSTIFIACGLPTIGPPSPGEFGDWIRSGTFGSFTISGKLNTSSLRLYLWIKKTSDSSIAELEQRFRLDTNTLFTTYADPRNILTNNTYGFSGVILEPENTSNYIDFSELNPQTNFVIVVNEVNENILDVTLFKGSTESKNFVFALNGGSAQQSNQPDNNLVILALYAVAYGGGSSFIPSYSNVSILFENPITIEN